MSQITKLRKEFEEKVASWMNWNQVWSFIEHSLQEAVKEERNRFIEYINLNIQPPFYATLSKGNIKIKTMEKEILKKGNSKKYASLLTQKPKGK